MLRDRLTIDVLWWYIESLLSRRRLRYGYFRQAATMVRVEPLLSIPRTPDDRAGGNQVTHQCVLLREGFRTRYVPRGTGVFELCTQFKTGYAQVVGGRRRARFHQGDCYRRLRRCAW
jgi:hypothetical protein